MSPGNRDQRGRKRIVISSVDMITPLGQDVESSYYNMIEGKSGIGSISRFDTSESHVLYAGEVPEINFLEYELFTARDLKNWFSPVISHSMLVTDRALKKAGFSISDNNRHRIAVTFSSAIGGLDAMLLADQRLNKSGATPHPFTSVNYCLNLIAGKISMYFKTQGPIFSPVAACATGNVSVITGSMLIQQGLADIVICGAVDFPLSRSTVASFSAMNGAYNTDKTDDRGYRNPGKTSRPFSIDRKGFVISEGAACLIITSLDYAMKNNMPVEAEIKGYSMNSDGYHFVMPKTETVAECMSLSLIDAGLNKDEIGHISTHGTSTKAGDLNEIKAIQSIWKDDFDKVFLSANKSQLGHSMGASSAIELIFSILSLKKGVVYPTLNYLPDPGFELNNIVNETRDIELDYVLNNSFGFGGTNACVIVGKI